MPRHLRGTEPRRQSCQLRLQQIRLGHLCVGTQCSVGAGACQGHYIKETIARVSYNGNNSKETLPADEQTAVACAVTCLLPQADLQSVTSPALPPDWAPAVRAVRTAARGRACTERRAPWFQSYPHRGTPRSVGLAVTNPELKSK